MLEVVNGRDGRGLETVMSFFSNVRLCLGLPTAQFSLATAVIPLAGTVPLIQFQPWPPPRFDCEISTIQVQIALSQNFLSHPSPLRRSSCCFSSGSILAFCRRVLRARPSMISSINTGPWQGHQIQTSHPQQVQKQGKTIHRYLHDKALFSSTHTRRLSLHF